MSTSSRISPPLSSFFDVKDPPPSKGTWLPTPTRCWIPDEQTEFCEGCRAQFRRLTFRHHCRYCGGSFCGACSKRKIEFLRPQPEVLRACEACFSKLEDKVPLDMPPCGPNDELAVKMLGFLKDGKVDEAMAILESFRVEPFYVDASTDYTTPLLHCVGEGLVEMAKDLLCKGARLHINEALHTALHVDHLELFELLLQFQADANSTLGDSETVLIQAILRNNVSMVKALLEHEAKPNIPTRDGLAPLCVAALWGTSEIMQALLRAGADPNIYVGNERRPLLAVAIDEDKPLVVDALLTSSRLDVDLFDDLSGMTPLMLAASVNRPNIVKKLVEKGARVDAVGTSGQTALIVAARHGFHRVCRMLLGGADPENPADVKIHDKDGLTALGAAIVFIVENAEKETRRGVGEMGTVVRLMLRSGAHCNVAAMEGGATPLVAIASLGDPWPCLMEALLRAGADPAIPDDSGNTALLHAARGGHAFVVSRLLTVQPPLDLEQTSDASSMTALMEAATRGHSAVAAMLVRAGASVTAVNDDGLSALDMAAVNGHTDSVLAILNHSMTAPVCSAAFSHAIATKDASLLSSLLEGISSADESVDGPLLIRCLEATTAPALAEAVLLHANKNGREVAKQRHADTGRSSVMVAASHGGGHGLPSLLSMTGVLQEINARDNDGNTALLIACRSERPTAALHLLNVRGVDVFASDQKGVSPLMVAAVGGRPGDSLVLSRLLAAGADVAGKDSHGCSALAYAAAGGNVQGVLILLDNGASVSDCDRSGEEPLIAAIKALTTREPWYGADHAGVVEALLSAGADPDARDVHGVPALHMAAFAVLESPRKETTALLDICSTLLSYGARLVSNEETTGNVDILKRAVECKDDVLLTTLVAGLLEDGSEEIGVAALMAAVDLQNPRAVATLLRAGVPVDSVGVSGHTALLRAVHAEGGDVRKEEAAMICVLRVILSHFPELEATMDDGRTAVCVAVDKGNATALSFLLSAGASANVLVSKAGSALFTTPLLEAVRKKSPAMVLSLLRHKANVVPDVNPNGLMVDAATVSPLGLAVANGDKEIQDMLLYFGAPPSGISVPEDGESEGPTVTSHLPALDPMGMQSFSGGDFCATASGHRPADDTQNVLFEAREDARARLLESLQTRQQQWAQKCSILRGRAVCKADVLKKVAGLRNEAAAKEKEVLRSVLWEDEGQKNVKPAREVAVEEGDDGGEIPLHSELRLLATIVPARLKVSGSTEPTMQDEAKIGDLSSPTATSTVIEEVNTVTDKEGTTERGTLGGDVTEESGSEVVQVEETTVPVPTPGAPSGGGKTQPPDVDSGEGRQGADAVVESVAPAEVVKEEGDSKGDDTKKGKGTIKRSASTRRTATKKAASGLADDNNDDDPLFILPSKSGSAPKETQEVKEAKETKNGEMSQPEVPPDSGAAPAVDEPTSPKAAPKTAAKPPPDYSEVYADIYATLGPSPTVKAVAALLGSTKTPKEALAAIWEEARLTTLGVNLASVTFALQLCSLQQKGLDPTRRELERVGPERVWPPTFKREASVGVRNAIKKFTSTSGAATSGGAASSSKAPATDNQMDSKEALNVFSSTDRKKRKPRAKDGASSIFADL